MSLNNQTDNKNKMNLKLQKRLATYSTVANVAVLSGLALSGVAHAVTIKHDVNPDEVHTAIGIGNGYGIDFDQDGNDEFSLVRKNTFGDAIYLDLKTVGPDRGVSAAGYPKGAYMYLNALDQSVAVGPSRTDFVQDAAMYLGYGASGQFPGAGDKYVGVRFILNDSDIANPGQHYYGWILLNVAADSSSVTIREYGYEDVLDGSIPTAVNLSDMSANTADSWWRVAAVGVLSTLTAMSLWWRRQVSQRLSD